MDMNSMSVADVRKSLGTIRTAWENHTVTDPLNTSDIMFNGMSISEFAFNFVYQHHEKRHCKTNSK